MLYLVIGRGNDDAINFADVRQGGEGPTDDVINFDDIKGRGSENRHFLMT